MLYIKVTNLLHASFVLSISHCIGARYRVIVTPILHFSVPDQVESYAAILVLDLGQGLYSIEDD